MISKHQSSNTENPYSYDQINEESFNERYILTAVIDDTLSNLSADLDTLKIVLKGKKRKSFKKIGERGFMTDNMNKKLKGNFFKYIYKVFGSYSIKIKKLPQTFITNASIKLNKLYVQKPLRFLFEHYNISIPKELSLFLDSGNLDLKGNKGDSQSNIVFLNKDSNMNTIKTRSIVASKENSEYYSSEKGFLKKIMDEYTFEFVFDNIFLKSEYFTKLIEELKKDPRYTSQYIEKFLKQAKQCMNNLKG